MYINIVTITELHCTFERPEPLVVLLHPLEHLLGLHPPLLRPVLLQTLKLLKLLLKEGHAPALLKGVHSVWFICDILYY